jgi:glutamate carboxypeptidase
VAAGLGLAPLTEAAVGGGSDGNLLAGLGLPVLDGLGAVGGGAHAEGEYVEVDAMEERAALVTALVQDLLVEDLPGGSSHAPTGAHGVWSALRGTAAAEAGGLRP